MKKIMYSLLGFFSLVFILGVVYAFYYLVLEPRVFYKKIQEQASGFLLKKTNSEIIAGGKYFGEKYRLEILDKNSDLLIPTVPDRNMFIDAETVVSGQGAPLFVYRDSFGLSLYRCTIEKNDNVDMGGCKDVHTEAVYGLDVKEYEKDNNKYLCVETEKSKKEIVKNLLDFPENNLEGDFNLFVWVYSRVRGYPKNPKIDPSAKESTRIGESVSINFMTDKKRVLESVSSSDLYRCKTSCKDYLCGSQVLESYQKI